MAKIATSGIVANRKWKMPISDTNGVELMQESAASMLSIGGSSMQEKMDVLNIRKNKDGQQQKPNRMPHKKVFHLRNSLLTDFMEVSHVQTIRAIFVAFCVFTAFTSLLSESPVRKSVILDLKLILWSFGKFPLAVLAWLAIQLSAVFLLFLPLSIWATHRTGGKLRANFFDYFMLTYCIGYVAVALGYFPTHFIMQNALSPASTVFLASEQVRMIMKMYSFLREKAVDAFTSETGNLATRPQFSNFLYFVFAPTLLYRDTYPRMPGPVRWPQVAYHFAGFLLAVMWLAHILQHFATPTFASIDYANGGLTRSELIQLVFRCSVPTISIKFIVFYGLLHCWQNLFAELLRFGDREFYRDWWNSASYSYYYRTWNIVVHEWLHQYCYRDLSLLFARRRKNLQPVWQITTLLLSAVMHEYFVMVTFHCFLPIMFVLFAGFGIVMFFLHSGSGSQHFASITIWLSLFMGYGLLLTFYGQEWCARRKCPSIFVGENEKWKDFFVPRLLTCGWSASVANSGSNGTLDKDTGGSDDPSRDHVRFL